jgi:hypothetical protein
LKKGSSGVVKRHHPLFSMVLMVSGNGVDRPPKNAMLNQRVNELGGTLRTSVRQGFARASFALKTL